MAGTLRLYPEVPSRRRAMITRDVLYLLLVAFFIWCGVKIYQAVDHLSALGTAVSDAGTSIQDGFGSAARAVGGVPLVGDSLAHALSGAGSGTGGNLVSLGQQGADDIHRLAMLAGLVVAVLPTLVLVLAVLPGRLRQIKALAAAGTVLGDLSDPNLRRLVASRAAFSLPYGVLLDYTRDPLGDLAAGRYDRLVAAALNEAGLRDTVA